MNIQKDKEKKRKKKRKKKSNGCQGTEEAIPKFIS